MATINFADGTRTLPENSVTRQELIDWVHYQQFAPGSAARALDTLTGVGLVEITSATDLAKTMQVDAVTAIGRGAVATATLRTLQEYLCNSHTPAGSAACDLAYKTTIISSGHGATITIPNATVVGHEHLVLMPTSVTGPVVMTGTFAGFTSITFGAGGGGVGYSAALKWDGAAWTWIGGNALVA